LIAYLVRIREKPKCRETKINKVVPEVLEGKNRSERRQKSRNCASLSEIGLGGDGEQQITRTPYGSGNTRRGVAVDQNMLYDGDLEKGRTQTSRRTFGRVDPRPKIERLGAEGAA